MEAPEVLKMKESGSIYFGATNNIPTRQLCARNPKITAALAHFRCGSSVEAAPISGRSASP
jgi:hypothetical protein